MFAAPEVVTVGGKSLKDKIYPTPVLQDLDGDGIRELVIGDLWGNLFFAKPMADANDVTWSALRKFQADGKPLKLNNW